MIVHMGYSSDSDRPAKRIKRSQPYQRPSTDLSPGLQPGFVAPPGMPPDPTYDSSTTISQYSALQSPGDQALGWQRQEPSYSSPQNQLFSPFSTSIEVHDGSFAPTTIGKSLHFYFSSINPRFDGLALHWSRPHRIVHPRFVT